MKKGIAKLGKKNLKIIAATAMSIFSLFAAVTGVFAWFTSKLTAASHSDEFGIYSDDSQITTLSCYVIRYDGVYGALARKLVSGGDHSVSMSEYDYILRDRNINTPLFFRIEIAGFDTGKDLQVSIPASGSYYASNTSHIDNKLSNVVCAKFSYGLLQNSSVVADTFVLEGNEISGGDAETIYRGMRDRARTIEGTPFVKSTTVKDSVVFLTIDHTALYQASNISHRDIDDDGVLDDIVVIYLGFDYYETNSVNLVEDYVESYDGSGLDYAFTFESDIGTITLRDVGAN